MSLFRKSGSSSGAAAATAPSAPTAAAPATQPPATPAATPRKAPAEDVSHTASAPAASTPTPASTSTTASTSTSTPSSIFRLFQRSSKKDSHSHSSLSLSHTAAPAAAQPQHSATARPPNPAHRRSLIDSDRHSNRSTASLTPSTGRSLARGAHLSTCPALQPEDYDQAQDYRPPRLHSRLHTTLDAVLSDDRSLDHFIRYLSQRNAINLLHFYLACSKFKAHYTDANSGREVASVIYSRFILDDSVRDTLVLPEKTLQDLMTWHEKDPEHRKPPSPDHFAAGAQAVHAVLRDHVFPHYLLSEQYGKYCMSILTSQDLILEDIIRNDEAMSAFMQFMDSDGSPVLMQFWLLSDNFQRYWSETSESQRRDDALAMYNRFISLEATDPLGLDENTRVTVEANICSADGIISADCFAPAQFLCYTALRLHFLPRFRQGELYYKFLNDLMAKVETAPPVGSDDKQGALSPLSPLSPNSAKPGGNDSAFPFDRDYYSTSRHLIGQMDEWGVFLRDAEVAKEPSMALDGFRYVPSSRMLKMFGKAHPTLEEQDMALQMCKMLIMDLRREMQECNTLYVSLRQTAAPTGKGGVSNSNGPAAPAGNNAPASANTVTSTSTSASKLVER